MSILDRVAARLPMLSAIAVYEFAIDAERDPASTSELLAAFRAKRARRAARVEAVLLEDLWCVGRHPESGQVAILRHAPCLTFRAQIHLPGWNPCVCTQPEELKGRPAPGGTRRCTPTVATRVIGVTLSTYRVS